MTQPTTLHRTAQAMARHGVAALLIGPGADLTTLTSYRAHLSERLTLMVARTDGAHALIVPELERAVAQTGSQGVAIRSFAEGEDPMEVVAAALDGIAPTATIGIGDQLWATFLLDLQRLLPQVSWTVASTITREIRMAKDAVALAGLRRAGQAIDAVHRRMADFLMPGRTEAEAARAISAAMLEEGHDHAAFVIVGSGPNGASPHHDTSERVLQHGDAVVVDIGGPVDGWFSDCTRNYVLGEAPQGYRAAFEVLHAAQRAAVAQVRPGVTAASVDAAARAIIADAGYGPAFIHRTGHGIGLEVHEEPWITGDNDLPLQEGMTFSVEPGIYLDGRFGMRIEDIVAVTADGVERLNTTDTDLVQLPS